MAPAAKAGRPVLVTGGAGFIGSNLVDRLARAGHHVLVFDALSRPGVEHNLAWLQARHPARVRAVIADLRDEPALRGAVEQAGAVFHLAAQVAVTTSLQDPVADFQINLAATLSLLETLRRRAEGVPLVFASTNKVYGNLADIELVDVSEGGGEGGGEAGYLPVDAGLAANGIGESRALDFYTPYGCSKGAADQYVLDYARGFGVPAAVLRMSCIYGPRQLGTEDQGWLAHFLLSVLRRQPITIYGDGRQVRDVLYVEDAVDAYLAAWRRIGEVSGTAYNLGGGSANAVTLLAVIREIERLTGITAMLRFAEWRPGDQRYFVADARRAAAELGLAAPLGWRTGLAHLLGWMREERVASPADVALQAGAA